MQKQKGDMGPNGGKCDPTSGRHACIVSWLDFANIAPPLEKRGFQEEQERVLSVYICSSAGRAVYFLPG